MPIFLDKLFFETVKPILEFSIPHLLYFFNPNIEKSKLMLAFYLKLSSSSPMLFVYVVSLSIIRSRFAPVAGVG